MTTVALAFAVLHISNEPGALARVLAAHTTTMVIFLLLGGVVADRFSRVRVMFLADVLRGWFGPDAGRPGTWHQVRLTPGPPWRLDPVRRATDGEDPGAAGGEGGVHGSAYPDGATRSSSAHD